MGVNSKFTLSLPRVFIPLKFLISIVAAKVPSAYADLLFLISCPLSL